MANPNRTSWHFRTRKLSCILTHTGSRVDMEALASSLRRDNPSKVVRVTRFKLGRRDKPELKWAVRMYERL